MLPLNSIYTIVGIVGGTVAATISVIKLFDSRREKKRRVKVTTSYGIPINMVGVRGDVVLVKAANPGSQPVTLTSWGFLLPNGSTLVTVMNVVDGTVRLPYRLGPGDNCMHWMERSEIAKVLLRDGFRQQRVELVAFYSDALDIKYKSKAMRFDLTKYL